jgi:hypothetical protein
MQAAVLMKEPYPPEEAVNWSIVHINIIAHMPHGSAYNQECRTWLQERRVRYYNRYAGEFIIEDTSAAVEFRLLFD